LNKFNKIINFLFIFLILISAIKILGYKYEGQKIKSIKFTGIINSDKKEAAEALLLKEGDYFSASKASESIKILYKLGYYNDVKLDIKEEKGGLILNFIVDERPKIKEISFKGNDEISESDLNEAIKEIVKVDDIYQETKINQAINVIYQKYYEEGYNDVSILAHPVIDEKDKKCKVIFNIKEGDRVRVKEIKILGVKAFPEKKIIKQMDTHIDDWLHSGIFKQEQYEKDKENIIKFYKNNGYIFAKIEKEELIYRIEGKKGKKERKLYITLNINEGEQYKFGGYEVEGYTIFTKEEIEGVLKHRVGEIFNQERFESDIQSLQQLYGSRGYIFANIMSDKRIDKEKKVISYNIKIREGEIAHLENIIIRGNTKTKDYVIKREILIKEGELFNSYKIRRSQEKIYNLGFFKNVQIDVKPGSAEGLMNLIFEVEEQMTGLITLGVMWGSVDGFGGYEEVSENNFLGRGIRIHERIEYQQKKQNYEAGIRYPWIFGTPLAFSFSFFYRNRTDLITPAIETNSDGSSKNAYYNKQEWGISSGLDWQLSDIVTLSALYGIELYKYYRPRLTPQNLSLREKMNKGDFIKSSLTLAYTYDSRDNIFNPTRGFYFSQSWQIVGGPLGGNDKYMKYITDTSKYFPLIWKFVFVFHFNYGLIDRSFDGKPIDKTINADDLLYIGGVESLRGYKYWETQWEVGGFSRIYSNLELRFPIAEQILWMVFFGDTGNLWRRSHQANFNYKEYYYSTGFGFRVQIPMIPIRLYFSKRFHYDRNKNEWILENKGIGSWEFDLSVGGLF